MAVVAVVFARRGEEGREEQEGEGRDKKEREGERRSQKGSGGEVKG